MTQTTANAERNELDSALLEIARYFDVAITAAEARSLAPTPDSSRDLDWLLEMLEEYGLFGSRIPSLGEIDFEKFQSLGIALIDEHWQIFYLDHRKQQVVLKSLVNGKSKPIESLDIDALNQSASEIVVVSLHDREKLATIPGIEKHWFFASLWKHRGHLLQAGIAALLTNIFAVGTSLFAMVVYNNIIPSNAMNSLLVLVVGMAILLVADFLVKTTRSTLLGHAGVQSDVTIADKLFKQILDVSFQKRRGAVGEIANVIKEYEQIREFFTSATLVSLIDLPFALIFVWFIWYLGGMMVVPVMLGILILFTITLFAQPKLKKIAEQSLEDAQNKHAVLVEALSGLETLKMLGAGGLLRRRYKNILEKQSVLAEETKRQMFFSSNLTQEVQQAVQIAVIAVGALLVSEGEFGFGAIIACTILSGKALVPFVQLAQLLSRLNQVFTGYKALSAIMGAETEHVPTKIYSSYKRFKGGLRFQKLCFSYPDADGEAISDFSVTIKPNEKVALIGRVGSGKTTLGKLITKLYTPDSGHIYFDSFDSRQIDPSEIRENLGVVSQEPWLIAGTLEQNILLGASDWTEEDIRIACLVSGVHDFCSRHSDGLKMRIFERGEGLSGGQKQAISLARALLRKPPIFLFDEPTSSMDIASEKLFISRFNKYLEMNPATCLIITHRSSLIELVDRVLVLDNGRLVKDSIPGELKSSDVKEIDQGRTSK